MRVGAHAPPAAPSTPRLSHGCPERRLNHPHVEHGGLGDDARLREASALVHEQQSRQDGQEELQWRGR